MIYILFIGFFVMLVLVVVVYRRDMMSGIDQEEKLNELNYLHNSTPTVEERPKTGGDGGLQTRP
jgi:hypothetical protein